MRLRRHDKILNGRDEECRKVRSILSKFMAFPQCGLPEPGRQPVPRSSYHWGAQDRLTQINGILVFRYRAAEFREF